MCVGLSVGDIKGNKHLNTFFKVLMVNSTEVKIMI